jgi:hypothetical protein
VHTNLTCKSYASNLGSRLCLKTSDLALDVNNNCTKARSDMVYDHAIETRVNKYRLRYGISILISSVDYNIGLVSVYQMSVK